jgi:hypothetical protein
LWKLGKREFGITIFLDKRVGSSNRVLAVAARETRALSLIPNWR